MAIQEECGSVKWNRQCLIEIKVSEDKEVKSNGKGEEGDTPVSSQSYVRDGGYGHGNW